MVKKILKLSAFIATLISATVFANIEEAEVAGYRPADAIVLKLPNNDYANWKEINRSTTEKELLVECIPLNQTAQNWSELISIQFYDRSNWNKNITYSIENVLDLFREATLAAYQENEITWEIIEKNESDIIYEWIVHKPCNSIPQGHVLAHAFLTETGLHRIGFTRKNGEMSSEQREKWIGLLKESVSIVSFEEAVHAHEWLSLVDRLKSSLDLGIAFQNWKVVFTSSVSENSFAAHIPPSQTEDCITECLGVLKMNHLNFSSLDQLLEMEKKSMQKNSPKKIKFHILKKSPTELIYSCSYPKDQLQVTMVVRDFISDQGCYSLRYERRLKEAMKKEETIEWKNRLEMIKVSN